jgi:hypothetical protein
MIMISFLKLGRAVKLPGFPGLSVVIGARDKHRNNRVASMGGGPARLHSGWVQATLTGHEG